MIKDFLEFIYKVGAMIWMFFIGVGVHCIARQVLVTTGSMV